MEVQKTSIYFSFHILLIRIIVPPAIIAKIKPENNNVFELDCGACKKPVWFVSSSAAPVVFISADGVSVGSSVSVGEGVIVGVCVGNGVIVAVTGIAISHPNPIEESAFIPLA